MRRYPLYIFDLDGTLYRGEEPTPGAVETVSRLRDSGSAIRFLTNNSGQTRNVYAEKLMRLGFEAQTSEVYSSALGTARVCADRGYRRVFVVGEAGLATELSTAGIESVTESPDAVVVGICRGFTYDWMNQAMQHVLAGAVFLATNPDATYPLAGGRLEPGAGAIVSSIATCSGIQPEVIGKPNPLLIQMILSDAGVGGSDALVVGDRLETDIQCGVNAGCDTHLVLCGVCKEAPQGLSWSEDLSGLL